METQTLTNAIFLLTKLADRPSPLAEHEALLYIQAARWVEQTLRLRNLALEGEIRRIEGLDEEIEADAA